MTSPDPAPHDAYAALRVPQYRDYLIGSSLALFGRQAVLAAVTWQVYEWTRSAAALGLVGVVNVLPLLALSLPAGALADQHDRRRLIAAGTAVLVVANGLLALLSAAAASLPPLAPLVWGNAALRAVATWFEL
ncbi:MAG: Enterobactin exporter EntS, partial [Verrucomicrobiota bacterium]